MAFPLSVSKNILGQSYHSKESIIIYILFVVTLKFWAEKKSTNKQKEDEILKTNKQNPGLISLINTVFRMSTQQQVFSMRVYIHTTEQKTQT